MPEKETGMSQTSTNSSQLNPIYSRIKIKHANPTESEVNEITSTITKQTEDINSIEYSEAIDDELSIVVQEKPTEIDAEDIQALVSEVISVAGIEIWVRRIFPEELAAVKEGEKSLE